MSESFKMTLYDVPTEFRLFIYKTHEEVMTLPTISQALVSSSPEIRAKVYV